MNPSRGWEQRNFAVDWPPQEMPLEAARGLLRPLGPELFKELLRELVLSGRQASWANLIWESYQCRRVVRSFRSARSRRRVQLAIVPASSS